MKTDVCTSETSAPLHTSVLYTNYRPIEVDKTSNRTTCSAVRQKNMAMSPAGPGIENDCAGEGQLQFTRPNQQKWTKLLGLYARFVVLSALTEECQPLRCYAV